MRDWLPDEIVDQLESVGAESIQYIIADTTIGLVRDLHEGEISMLVAVATDAASDDAIVGLLFIIRDRFVQYWLRADGPGLQSVRGKITKRQLRALPHGWSDLEGVVEELSCEDDPVPKLTENAIWLLRPTVH